MTVILGIGDYMHDGGVAIIEDGKIKYTMNEERFSRIKFDPRFEKSLDSVFQYTKYKSEDIDIVTVAGLPLLKHIPTQLQIAYKRMLSEKSLASENGIPQQK